jgi:hypothetical protein
MKMKHILKTTILLANLFACLAYAGPECPRDCDASGAPEIIADLKKISEHITDSCMPNGIVVTKPDPDDPCTSNNILAAPYSSKEGGPVSYEGYVDRKYVSGKECAGKILDNVCYIKYNGIYAMSGSTTFQKGEDGIILNLKNNQKDCKNQACLFPYELPKLNVLIPFGEIYDCQHQEGVVIDCPETNCYSIDTTSAGDSTPGGYHLDGATITVTRQQDGTLTTKMYLNRGYPTVTSGRIAHTIAVGEEIEYKDFLGKKPSKIVSCDESFEERRKLYFPKKKKKLSER